MTEQERLAAALEYQQAQQPARMNPNLAAQGARGRENMMPPTSVMDERYPAFKRNQEDAEKLMLGLDIVGSAIPLAGPAVKGAKILGQAAAPQIAQALENYTFKTGMALPIDVYHGSPHRFAATAKNPLGEFDPTKIGTGEGAQAMGYGHYLAERPETARIYSADRAYVGATMQGKPTTVNFDDPVWLAQKTIDEFGDVAKAKAHLEMVARTAGKYQSAETKAQLKDAIDLVASNKVSPKGSVYKVDLSDEAVSRMLDYDKPLSQQHPDVQAAVKQLHGKDALGRPVDAMPIDEDTRGQWLYEALQQGRSQKLASEALREAGIPGIKYLDAARNKNKGTRNFVVFPGNEGLLNILGRE